MILRFCDHCNTELAYQSYSFHNRPHTFPVEISGIKMTVQVKFQEAIALDLCDKCFDEHIEDTIKTVNRFIGMGLEWSVCSQKWVEREDKLSKECKATVEVTNKGLTKKP